MTQKTILRTIPNQNIHSTQKPPLSTDAVSPVNDKPFEIVLEITGKCNLNCACCTSQAKKERAVPFNTIRPILDQAKTINIPAIRFTGGEPILNPELSDMLVYAKSLGFYILLNTNATLITQNHLRLFSKTVNNVLVSLQGFNNASDAAITHANPLSFKEKIATIFRLRGRIPRVRIGTVITPTLIQHFSAYVTLVKKIRADAWELFRPMTYQASQDAPDLSTYQNLARKILSLQNNGLDVKFANALPFCILPDLHRSASIMLGARFDDGHSRLIRDARGFFKPSYFINKNLGTDIINAWRHPFLKKIRNPSYLPAQCHRCDFFKECLGGSRAMSHITYGTYFAPDPLFQKRPAQALRIIYSNARNS